MEWYKGRTVVPYGLASGRALSFEEETTCASRPVQLARNRWNPEEHSISDSKVERQ